ncbi:Zn-ribbon domain-containing OB-fold protein [Propylenella binzhouense]|uniref:Zn-ribbon domain-containing OB-fold protein n=1 Tax=Propylenella binzhouense TaxID=2555902 RepID=A0A964WSD6_9HYPH|nr:Zn-ribbon domain-containing OB-fold protein [Propylenella binzhouense]MYZ46864.1 Zn-ribbon domain-containing OB-fold protein [Propylenella binzhouense]
MTEKLPSPDPLISLETQPFWDATAKGELRICRCRQCRSYIWYPRSICPFCMAEDCELVPASGGGTIYSFTITRRGSGAYKDSGPYVLAYVELDEGPRVMTNIVGIAPDEVRIGSRVGVTFDPAEERGWSLPRFAPETVA